MASSSKALNDEYGILTSAGSTHVLAELELDSGIVLKDVATCYQSWGTLSRSKDNVVVVFHALTGNADVGAWWGQLLGIGKPLDTSRYFIVCANILGSCYGSTGPSSIDPSTGEIYGSNWPQITVRDCVKAQAATLRHLGIGRVHCVVGGSLGGMLAIEYMLTVTCPAAGALVTLSSSGRHHPWQIGIGECQRQAIYADPNWKDGEYSEECRPDSGLQVARMMAMFTYRTHPAYTTKFGRRIVPVEDGELDESVGSLRIPQIGPGLRGSTLGMQYDVQSYLYYQGRKFLQRKFDARSYVSLTLTMDTHDVSRDRGTIEEVLARITQPTIVVSISSDILYPYEEQLELSQHIPDSQHHMIQSPEGHDGFLLEHKQIGLLLRGFFDQVSGTTSNRPEPEI